MGQMIRFQKGNSGEIARMRLRLILASDQSHISPGILVQIRDDMIEVLSRYAQVDAARITLGVNRPRSPDGLWKAPVLSVCFPVRERYLEQT